LKINEAPIRLWDWFSRNPA